MPTFNEILSFFNFALTSGFWPEGLLVRLSIFQDCIIKVSATCMQILNKFKATFKFSLTSGIRPEGVLVGFSNFQNFVIRALSPHRPNFSWIGATFYFRLNFRFSTGRGAHPELKLLGDNKKALSYIPAKFQAIWKTSIFYP